MCRIIIIIMSLMLSATKVEDGSLCKEYIKYITVQWIYNTDYVMPRMWNHTNMTRFHCIANSIAIIKITCRTKLINSLTVRARSIQKLKSLPGATPCVYTWQLGTLSWSATGKCKGQFGEQWESELVLYVQP